MTNMDWARDQLDLAGYTGKGKGERPQIRNSVEALLVALEKQRHPSDDYTRKVIDLFSKLALGHNIAPKGVQDVGARWVQFVLGEVPVGTTVRVKDDAYTGNHAEEHNGRVGRLAAARGGYAFVVYDESAESVGQNHAPDKLEALMVVQ